jgi:hypothetical protein
MVPTHLGSQNMAPEDTPPSMDASEISDEFSEDEVTSSSESDDTAKQKPRVFQDQGKLPFRLETYLYLISSVLNIFLT